MTPPNLSWRMTHTNSFGVLTYETDHLISARWPDLIIIKKNERTRKIVDFAVLAGHRVKLKECEKRDKYLDLTRELKKRLLNMKVTIIPMALGTVTKELVPGLEDLEIMGQVENVQTTALLRSARILRTVLVSWEELLSRKLQRKTIS